MEPPTKRRRHDSSPLRRRVNIDEDLDELCSSPPPHHDQNETDEQGQSQDDGYQLVTKRLEANQRLEATFAHIIEKYSKNFDGIGDEIDMETGEIVVNNGHLSGMRHEGDLGGTWPVDDEEEGILLEDLSDMFSDDDGQDETREPGSTQDDKAGEKDESEKPTDGEANDEDNTSLEEVTSTSDTGALVPANGSGTTGVAQQLPGVYWAPSAAVFPNAYGNLFMGFIPTNAGASLPGSVFPEVNNAAQPSTTVVAPANSAVTPNGQVPYPFMFNPWAMFGLLPPQSWGQPSVSMQPPAAFGHSNLALPEPTAVVPDKSKAKRYKFPIQKGRTSIWAPGSRLEKDERPGLQPRSRLGRPPGPKNRKHHEIIPREGRKVESVVSSQGDTENQGDRRMSGRVRKQTEYMGKVSWSEANQMVDSSQETNSQESASAPRNQPGSDALDELALDDIETTPRSSQASSKTSRRKSIVSPGLVRIIPDSQESATPPTSSAPQPQPRAQEQCLEVSSSGAINSHSLCALSENRAPLSTSQEPKRAEPPPIPQMSEKTAHREGIIEKTSLHSEQSTPSSRRKRRREGQPEDSPTAKGGSPSLTKKPSTPLAREIRILHKTISDSPKFKFTSSKDESMQQEDSRVLRSAKSRDTGESRANVANPSTEHDPGKDTAVTPKAHSEPILDSGTAVDSTVPKSSVPESARSPMSTIPATEDETSINGVEEPPSPLTREKPLAWSPASKKPSKPFSDRSPSTPGKQRQIQSLSSKPQTPRNTAIRTSRAPSSRRSLLSLVSKNNSDSESEDDIDELNKDQPSPFQRSAGTSTIKSWRSSILTREIYHTPIKKRHKDPVSPSSVVKTPGGTVRTCGINGYRCGRDFCFNCL